MQARITLKQLTFFAALARTRHFRKAAESEGVTQPSLSAQIAGLEEALGVRLVERGGRNLTLTAAGRALLPRTLRILDEVQGLEDHAVGMRAGKAGVLNVGVSSTVGPYLMPSVVRDLHRSYPEMGLFIREGVPESLTAELLDGAHDLIISQLPLPGADTISVPLLRESLSLVVAADHPLAGRDRLEDADLAGLQVLTLGPGYALNTLVSALCSDLGAQISESYQGTSLDALRQMIGMGMGAGFLPALYVESEIRDRDASVAVLPFRQGRFTRTVGFGWRRSTGRMSAIDAVIAQVRATVRASFSGIVTVL